MDIVLKNCLLSIAWIIAGFAFGQEIRDMHPPAYSIPLVSENTQEASSPDTLQIYGEYNSLHWGLKDGLSSQSITKVWFDSRNYLWIGTKKDGVCIFDGQEFRYLNTSNGLSSNAVNDFEEADDGRIWIATDAGISIFDGQEWEYRTMDKGNFGAEVIWSLLKDKGGRMFMGTAGGGFSIYFDREAEHHIDIDGDSTFQIRAMAEDSISGKVWIATWGNGVLEYQNGKLTRHLLAPSKEAAANFVNSILVRREEGIETVYAGTKKGLFQWKKGTWKSCVGEEEVTALKSDRKGVLWLGTTNGLQQWNSVKSVPFQERERRSKKRTVQSIEEDIWGGLWIGYRNHGLSKYQRDAFVHYRQSTGFPDDLSCVYQDTKGNLWLGMNSSGIVCYNGEHFLHYGPEQGFPSKEKITAIEEDEDQNLWFGLEGELVVRFDGSVFSHYSGKHGKKGYIDFNRNVRTLTYTQGQLWVGTPHSPVRISKDSIHYYGHRQNIVDHHEFLNSSREKNGAFWFTTNGGGVSRVDFEKNEAMILTTRTGLSTNTILDVTQDSFGNYWFNGEGKKIKILKAGSLNQELKDWQWMELGMEEGFPTNNLSYTQLESNGDLWISSSQGMCRVILKGKDIFEQDYQVKVYGYQEGFRTVMTEQEAMQGSNGKWWFYSKGGVSVWNPLKEMSNQPPIPVINDLKIKLQELDWEKEEGPKYSAIDAWSGLPLDLSLPYESNYLTFDFSAVSYHGPKTLEYSWKLVGFDDDFGPWTHTNTATYTELPWGNYQFELKCRDAFGNVSESIQYHLKIRKAYYHTWVFRISLILATLLIGYLAFQWRSKKRLQ